LVIGFRIIRMPFLMVQHFLWKNLKDKA